MACFLKEENFNENTIPQKCKIQENDFLSGFIWYTPHRSISSISPLQLSIYLFKACKYLSKNTKKFFELPNTD